MRYSVNEEVPHTVLYQSLTSPPNPLLNQIPPGTSGSQDNSKTPGLPLGIPSIFIPFKIADRLKQYITRKGIGVDQKIFPIFYKAAREVVNKAGKVVGIHLRPHDLRRHAATYASRSGVPIEIVSKIILRHANLSTTQRYLGTVSDVEAMRWIRNFYG